MIIHKGLNKYWQEADDLTIYEAAFWMVIKSDPQVHDYGCALDSNYDCDFEEHPRGASAVMEKCEILFSLARANPEIVTKGQLLDGKLASARETFIRKSYWINWLNRNNYSEIADLFKFTLPTQISCKPIPAQIHQEQEILKVIKELGYSPTKLPKNIPGIPGVKAAVRAKLTYPIKVFDKAWERLSSSKDINYNN